MLGLFAIFAKTVTTEFVIRSHAIFASFNSKTHTVFPQK